jgi:hypothetical protein
MVRLGAITNRMKDFYDIWWLASHFAFDGRDLAEALDETFRCRGTDLSTDPVALGDNFSLDAEKQAQWVAYVRRNGLRRALDPG